MKANNCFLFILGLFLFFINLVIYSRITLENIVENEDSKSKLPLEGFNRSLSRDSRLAAVRQLRLAQRYGDPGYKQFQSSSIMRFYGFSGYEMLTITRQGVSDVSIGEYIYPARYFADSFGKDINAHGETIMDAAGTRFGIFFNPMQGHSKNMYAILELDFRGTNRFTQYTAKIRHSFGEISWESGALLFGQYFHPLFLVESFPRVINFNLGAPFEPQSLVPQLRVTQEVGPCEFLLGIMGQSFLNTYGPNAFSNVYLEDAIIPDIAFGFKYRFGLTGESFYGFVIDYLRVVPRLSSLGVINGNSAAYKVNEYVDAISTEIFGHNVFHWGEVNFKFILSQNASSQVLISGFAVKTLDPITDYRTYVPTNAVAFWLDTFYLFYRTQMQLGLFFGYTHYLGAFTPLYIDPSTDQPISYSRPIGNTGFSVDYVYRVALRYSYNLGSFRCGLELEWDLIAYSERLDRYGRGLNPKPVNAFSPIISIDYVY
ncbi:hypothetical protein [Candidatus Babela massiliensis]|uniref:Porin superfamily protein n=1 Tax=Candidatus Babela massiliensis TaxID=673862 RepID=V6DIM2_9BACT|nr:hypothetical protein [Candidatus Babela massiliensis]CDK30773.1 Porin superfamily protein [Candidatus Babela massiliensis]